MVDVFSAYVTFEDVRQVRLVIGYNVSIYLSKLLSHNIKEEKPLRYGLYKLIERLRGQEIRAV